MSERLLGDDVKQRFREAGRDDAQRGALYRQSTGAVEQNLFGELSDAQRREAFDFYDEGWRDAGKEVPLTGR